MYLDKKNIYGWAMSQKLPVRDIPSLNKKLKISITYKKYDKGGVKGQQRETLNTKLRTKAKNVFEKDFF